MLQSLPKPRAPPFAWLMGPVPVALPHPHSHPTRTHLFPATSRTCSSVVLASSGGRSTKRLSRKDSTFRLAQPPISAGSAVSRFRSAFKLVNLVSFPKDLGKAWEGGRQHGGSPEAHSYAMKLAPSSKGKRGWPGCWVTQGSGGRRHTDSLQGNSRTHPSRGHGS